MLNKLKQLPIMTFVALLLLVALIANVYESNNTKQQLQAQLNSKPTEVEVYLNANGEPDANFSKEKAFEAATEVLKLAYIGDLTLVQKLESLAAGNDVNVIMGEDLMNKLHLVDYFKSTNGQLSTAYSLINMVELVTEQNPDLSSKAEIEDSVYLDPTTMSAEVPFDLYFGYPTGFTMKMVYSEGEWKYDPFSLLQQLKNSEIVTQNILASQSSD